MRFVTSKMAKEAQKKEPSSEVLNVFVKPGDSLTPEAAQRKKDAEAEKKKESDADEWRWDLKFYGLLAGLVAVEIAIFVWM